MDRESRSIASHVLQMIRDLGVKRKRQSRQQALGKGGAYSVVTERRRVEAPRDSLCGITDVGRTRERNEDAFHLSEDGRLLIVADGVGGQEAGEVASARGVRALIEHLTPDRLATVDREDKSMELVLLQAFDAAQQRVLAGATCGEGRPGMATTLIAACVRGDRLHTCHVGDVRCYVRNAGGLVQVTEDHSTVGLLVRCGQLSPEEARLHERKNEILQAVGWTNGIVPEVHSVGLGSGDRVLLCSDGLWEALPQEEICAVLDWEGSMRQRATQLVDRANEAGGHDNITVVLYEHS